jgi:hypothetical protein
MSSKVHRSHRPTFSASAVRDLLTVGDSESPVAVSTPSVPLFADIIAKMFAGTFRWADLVEDGPVVLPSFGSSSSMFVRPDPTTEADFKSAFADFPMEERVADIYDTSALTNDQFRAVMEWLCQNGWHVDDYDRGWVSAWPGQNYRTSWSDVRGLLTPPAEEDHCCTAKKVVALSAPGSDEGRRVAAPVPRFCRDARNCQRAGCAYVHGDTIPRLNDSCRFGAACGASDPTGVKRSQCLRMHPGEHYHPEMVIKRV